MLFLLDTNILIAMSKQQPGLADRLKGIPADAVLVTDNTKEFGRVAGLRTVNWLANR